MTKKADLGVTPSYQMLFGLGEIDELYVEQVVVPIHERIGNSSW